MSDDQTLFDAPVVPISALSGKPVPARARNTGPTTSHQAAERASKNISQKRAEVLIVLDDIRPATANEVRDEMKRRGLEPKESGPRSRLSDLEKEYGYVYIVRHADNQAVYTTTDRGHTAANDLRQAQGQEAA